MKNLCLILFVIVLALPLSGAKKATKAVQKNPEEVLETARGAFLDYDFEKAAEAYEEYHSLMQKSKQEPDAGYESEVRQLGIASNAFDRVEKIIVVDSLSLPGDTFYKSYRLSASSGKLVASEELPDNPGVPASEFAFLSEDGDYMAWSEADADGMLRLKESMRLLNGEWETLEIEIGDDENADYAYPFMSADGQTLYFASNGEASMGGYDIFVAQRDPLNGDFRQPLNIGMPFNSPYDDLMMALDEEKGIGWWATDRNSPEGNVTVYVYLINEVRQNYPSDTENLVSLARLDDYKSTQPEARQNDIKNLLTNLPGDNQIKKPVKQDFVFPLGKGKTYHKFSDFRNKKAAEKMTVYLKVDRELKQAEKELALLRRQFSGKNTSSASQIKAMETKVEKLREEARKTGSEVYRLEKAMR